MKKKYFEMTTNGNTADINIYGDITSWAWEEIGEVSAYTLSKQLDSLSDDITNINVYINSYGGEVAEGLAIYNALKRHKAKVTTYCDGFACSIASVVFMAGDERVMGNASLLMIHNAWSYASGNSEELRKQADDLDKITQASVEAYKAHSSLTEEEIKVLMDAETWILPNEALDYGFANCVDDEENKKASQNAFLQLFNIIKKYQADKDGDGIDDDKDDDQTDDDTTTDDGTTTDDDTSTDDEDDDKDASQKWAGFFNALLK